MSTYVGTCGNCGGDVVRPNDWAHAYLPAPEVCRSCGAETQRSRGRVLPMESAPRRPRAVIGKHGWALELSPAPAQEETR